AAFGGDAILQFPPRASYLGMKSADRRASVRTRKGRSKLLIEHRNSRKPVSTFRPYALALWPVQNRVGFHALSLLPVRRYAGEGFTACGRWLCHPPPAGLP